MIRRHLLATLLALCALPALAEEAPLSAKVVLAPDHIEALPLRYIDWTRADQDHFNAWFDAIPWSPDRAYMIKNEAVHEAWIVRRDR